MDDYVGMTTDALTEAIKADPAASERELELISRLANAIDELVVLTNEIAQLRADDGEDT